MKSKIIIGLGVALLVFTVACGGISFLFHSMVFAGEQHNTTSANIMIVFYTIADEVYMFWCDLSAEIIDNGDGTWDVISPQVTARGVNQAVVTYDYYQFKVIEPQYDEYGNPLPIYMADLNLQPPTADDLPKSEHIGKLVDVNPANAKPAVITRKWHGMVFNISCLVDQVVVDMWIADTLNIGDFVVVSFIEEHPGTEEINLAIVRGKVYKSW